jgi:UDP-glucuronate 4-epimerase
VTGGAGFIGSHLCDKLIERGENVICLDNFDPYYDPGIKEKNIKHNLRKDNFKIVKADIRDKKTLERVFGENDIEKIIHLAAKVGVRHSVKDPLPYMDVNVGGTLSLLEVCKDHDIENFIFISSSAIYGNVEKIPFNEDDPPKPISPYGVSKKSCELFCHAYHLLYDIPITCLRLFTVYGPRQRPDMAIYKFTKSIEEDKEIEVYGDGTSKRDYTYIDDIVQGILNALDRRFEFEIFNLASSRPVELLDLISLIEEKLGRRAKIKHVPERAGDIPITHADISKARRLLNFKSRTGIEDGIEKFIEWYRSP